MFFSGFLFISTHISLDLLSLGSVKGKLCQEYLYHKLLKSDNWFSSYSQKFQGCFLSHSVLSEYSATGMATINQCYRRTDRETTDGLANWQYCALC